MPVNQNTASEWDEEQANSGAHHDQPTGTDWAPEDTLEKGYERIPFNSIVTYMPLHEQSGSVAHEISGAVINDGELLTTFPGIGWGILGDTTYYIDEFNPGARLDSSGANSGLSEFTISCWINVKDGYNNSSNSAPNENWRFFWGKAGDSTLGTGGNNKMPDYALGIDPQSDTTTWEPIFVVADTNSGMPFASGNILDTGGWDGIGEEPANGWHHIAGTYDGSTMRLYVDGSVADTSFGPQSNDRHFSGESEPYFVGDDMTSDAERACEGYISECMVFNTALSDSQISELYNVVTGNSEYWAAVQELF